MKIVIAHLYPNHLNIYGDRGNILALYQRARWREIDGDGIRHRLGKGRERAERSPVFGFQYHLSFPLGWLATETASAAG